MKRKTLKNSIRCAMAEWRFGLLLIRWRKGGSTTKHVENSYERTKPEKKKP